MKKEMKKEINIRFENVLKLLKDKDPNNTQKNIIDTINLDFIKDESYFSELKSGKRKKIHEKLIKALHEKYNVNPDYLKLKSNCPFDDANYKLECFEHFVDTWDVLTSDTPDKYLHLTLDSNFYDFLIDYYEAIENPTEGLSSLETEKKALAELHLSNSNPPIKEYVLIPRNNFISIIDEVESYEKHINEVINFSEYKSYKDAKPMPTNSSKSKKEKLNELLPQKND